MWDFLRKKKKYRSEKSYAFDDVDRELSAQNRYLLREIKQKRQLIELQKLQKQLEDMNAVMYPEEETDDDEDFNAEQMLMQVLMSKLAANPFPGSVGDVLQKEENPSGNPTPSTEQPAEQGFSDEELLNVIKNLPKAHLRIAKKLDDKVLFNAIKGHFPSFDVATINRAIKLFRENF